MGINVLSRNLCGEKKVNKYNLFLKINFLDAWSDVTTLCYAKLEEALFSSKTIYIPTPPTIMLGLLTPHLQLSNLFPSYFN